MQAGTFGLQRSQVHISRHLTVPYFMLLVTLPVLALLRIRTQTILPFCTYRWQDGSTEPRYVVRQPGSYSVTVTNLCYSHSGDIDIDYESCAQELWMPNAFTPNGDGLNDRFLPVFSHPDEIEDFEMMVYDRWGSMVFLTKDMHTGWDGGDLPRGMYVWVIRYKSAREEEHTVKGSVMLGR